MSELPECVRRSPGAEYLASVSVLPSEPDPQDVSASKDRWPALIRLSDFLASSPEPVVWLVDRMLTIGGLGLIVGKPKIGKSSLARDLCNAVATGRPFLSRPVSQGTVLYLSLEDHPGQCRDRFARMHFPNGQAANVFVHVEPAPAKSIEWLADLVSQYRPALVIVDPLFRLIRVKDENRYAELSNATEPLIAIARKFGCAIVCCHHMRKAGGDFGDGILGSTAIFGFCDTAIELVRNGEHRMVRTTQRDGDDLPETILEMDADSGLFAIGSRAEDVSLDLLVSRIADLLSKGGEKSREEIIDTIGGNKTVFPGAFARAEELDLIVRCGSGKNGDPYRFSAV